MHKRVACLFGGVSEICLHSRVAGLGRDQKLEPVLSAICICSAGSCPKSMLEGKPDGGHKALFKLIYLHFYFFYFFFLFILFGVCIYI